KDTAELFLLPADLQRRLLGRRYIVDYHYRAGYLAVLQDGCPRPDDIHRSSVLVKEHILQIASHLLRTETLRRHALSQPAWRSFARRMMECIVKKPPQQFPFRPAESSLG